MILAAIPYGVHWLDKWLRRPLFGFGGIWLLVLGLLIAATVPVAVEGAKQQPVGQTVDDLRDGTSAMLSWARMSGRIVTISSPQSVAAGHAIQSLLIEDSGDAILINSDRVLEGLTSVTGRITNSPNAAEVAQRIAGPRLPDGVDIVDHYILDVDEVIVPPAQRSWAVSWILVALAAVLVAAAVVGYPVQVFARRPSQVTARSMAEGESVDAWLIDRHEQDGPGLRGTPGRLARVVRRSETDPFFTLSDAGTPRPITFKRHRWSAVRRGSLYFANGRVPVLRVHDWGIEVLLGFRDDADRARVEASFVESARGDELLSRPARAAGA